MDILAIGTLQCIVLHWSCTLGMCGSLVAIIEMYHVKDKNLFWVQFKGTRFEKFISISFYLKEKLEYTGE